MLLSRVRSAASDAVRRRTILRPLGPAALVAVSLLALASCGQAASDPRVVTLAELVTEQDAHDGSMVITEGIVQTFEQPRHAWIEDVDQRRVELLPPDPVEDLEGRRVRVTGRFTFVEDRGRGIEIDNIEVLSDPPAAWSAPLGAAVRAASPRLVPER